MNFLMQIKSKLLGCVVYIKLFICKCIIMYNVQLQYAKIPYSCTKGVKKYIGMIKVGNVISMYKA